MRRMTMHRKTEGVLPFFRLQILSDELCLHWETIHDPSLYPRISKRKREWLDKGVCVVIGSELYRRVDYKECAAKVMRDLGPI